MVRLQRPQRAERGSERRRLNRHGYVAPRWLLFDGCRSHISNVGYAAGAILREVPLRECQSPSGILAGPSLEPQRGGTRDFLASNERRQDIAASSVEWT